MKLIVKTLAILLLLEPANGRHIRCFPRYNLNPVRDATEACFGNPTAANMRQDFVIVYDRDLTVGQTKIYGFVAQNAVSGVTPLPVRSPNIYTMMATSNNSRPWRLWWCYGDYLVGCRDPYVVSGTWPTATVNGDNQECKHEGFKYQGTDSLRPPGNILAPNTPLGSYSKECYCKFTDASCQFDKFQCNSNYQVANHLPTDHLNGGIRTRTDLTFARIINCNLITKMKLGLAFKGTIIVCGLESFTVGSTYFIQNPSAYPATYLTITNASQQNWFTLTFPTSPVQWNQCTIKATGMFQTCATTNPFTHPRITHQISDPSCTTEGFCPILLDKSVPLSEISFYLVVTTRGNVKSCKKITVEICGNEYINLLIPQPQYLFQLSAGNQNVADVKTWFQLNLSTYCRIHKWTLEIEVAGVYSTFVGPLVRLNPSTQQLTISTIIATSLPFVKTFYIKAETLSGNFKRQKFTVLICGAEVITTLFSRKDYVYIRYTGTAPNYEQSPDAVNNFFTVDNPLCPITVYNRRNSNTLPYPYSNVQLTYIGTQKWLVIKTVTPFEHNMMIRAKTVSGSWTYFPMRAKVCGNEGITLNTAFPTYTTYAKDIGMQQLLQIADSAFINDDPFECPITTYTLYIKPGSIYVLYSGGQIILNPITRVIQTTTGSPTTTVLYIRAQTNSLVKNHYKTIIRVCGDEVLSLVLLTPPQYYYQFQSGLSWKNLVGVQVVTWFIQPTDCVIVSFDIYYFFSGFYYKSSSTQVNLVNQPNQIEITTDQNMKQTFFVKATSMGKISVYQDFEVWICGAEQLKPSDEDLFFVYDKMSGISNLQNVSFANYLNNNDEATCPVLSYSLHNANGSAYLGTTFLINSTTKKVFISTLKPGIYSVFLKAVTKGGIEEVKLIQAEICGDETIDFRPGLSRFLYFEFWQNSGYNYTWIYASKKYLDVVQSSNPRCPIIVQLSRLKYENLSIRPVTIINYPNTTVTMDISDGRVTFNTTELTNELFQIRVQTSNSPYFYIPIKLWIRSSSAFIFNAPPEFQESEGYTLNYQVNMSEPKPVGFYDFKWNITEPFDDKDNLVFLNFTSKIFGHLSFKFDPKTQKPFLIEDKSLHEMKYNHTNTMLHLHIQETPRGMIKYANELYKIRVILSDAEKLSNSKDMGLNITIINPILVNITDKVKKPPVVQEVILGKIERINVFGEVDIQLKNVKYNPKKLDLKTISNKTMDVYIEPQYKWNEWFNQDLSKVNLTWQLVRLTKDEMRVKLDFNEAPFVSPFIRYDKLVIHIPNVDQLFEQSAQTGRRLDGEVIETFTMRKSIQKQCYDTTSARNSVYAIYGVRTLLVTLFIIAFVISWKFYGPLERLITMMLELQLMSNFALLSITLPANYMIMSVVMKPFVSLNILREQVGSFEQTQIAETQSEEDLAYLGQRTQIGYTTFNVFRNLGTFGFILIFHVVKLLVVLVLAAMRKHNKKFKKIHKYLRDKTFFDDMLKIYVFGFIELGTSAILAFNAPTTNLDNSFLNISLAVIILFQGIVALPLIYSLILGQKQQVYRSRSFQQRWSTFLFGIRIFDKESWQKQLYVISFLSTRYLFLILAFVKTSQDGCFDVMLMMAIFLFNSAMFFSKAPLYGKWNNFLGRYNTVTMLVCTYHLIMFTDMVNSDQQYYAGWSLITVIFVFIIVNLLFFAYELWTVANKLTLFFLGKSLQTLLSPLFVFLDYLKDKLTVVFNLLKELGSWLTTQFMELWGYLLQFNDWLFGKYDLIKHDNEEKEATPRFFEQVTEEVMEEVKEEVKVEEDIKYDLKLVKGVWTMLAQRLVEENKLKELHGDNYKEHRPKEQPKILQFDKVKRTAVKEKLILVKGVWTRLAVRVNQELDYLEEKHKNHNALPPLLEKIIIFQVNQQKAKPAIKKVPIAKRRYSRWVDMAQLKDFEVKSSQAQFYDPALYYRDEDQTGRLYKQEKIGDDGTIRTEYLQSNPNLFGALVKKIVYKDEEEKLNDIKITE